MLLKMSDLKIHLFQLNIADQLPKYLGCEVKMCTTKCVLHECEVLGKTAKTVNVF